jgi:hypothetical protein
VKLVDFGPDGAFGGGDDTEHQVEFEAPAQGEWVSLDIPLSDFTALTTRENIAQLILVGRPTAQTTVYVDNVYFYKDPQTNVLTPGSAGRFRVYPNPVTSGTLVQLSAEAEQVDVFDLTGRLVSSSKHTSVIRTEDMNEGIYLLRVYTRNGGTETLKLVVN